MRQRLLFFFGLMASFFTHTSAQVIPSVYNVIDFGGKGDGKGMNTTAFNSAIQKCSGAGGGQVLVPPGTYVTGTIVLLSNVDFHLQPGAVIIGSSDTTDYLKNNNPLFNEGYNRYGLLYAFNAKNISITGQGTINGNGTHFMHGIDRPHMGHDFDRRYVRQGEDFMRPGTVFEDGPVSYDFRPGLMIQLQHCEQVQLTGVQLMDSPEWTIRLADCDNVLVNGISILNNPLIPNNDGIHCTNSRNIRISDCNISTGDDGIIVSGFEEALPAQSAQGQLLGNRTGKAENVTVTNCVISSRSACIRVGYGKQPIRNLVFNNLVMYASNRGIGVFSRDQSLIENVLFSNITIETRLLTGHWWGKGEPIHISAIRDAATGNAGKIRNIRFVNITANSETGVVLYGTSESVIEDLLFDQVDLTINLGKNSETYGGNFDLRPAYPISNALFKHDIPGVYGQYLKNVMMHGFRIHWGENLPKFFTHGLELDHVEGLTLDGYRLTPASSSPGLLPVKVSASSQIHLLTKW